MPHAYLALKLSRELFGKGPEALTADEQARLQRIASRQQTIEQRILGSDDAAGVVIPQATLDNRFREIQSRYASVEEFERDMAANNLDETGLRDAIERDLRVESVLERIAAAVPAITAVDAEIYYRLHPAAFDRPEARRLRHLLMTFDSPAEKQRIGEQLAALRPTLTTTEAFAQAALKYSQCPTAMDGGVLGIVKRNQLYAELEPAAFALDENEISPVLESPIGLHLLRCDEIFPGGPMPFAEVCGRIIEHLTDKRRNEAQRAWIQRLG